MCKFKGKYQIFYMSKILVYFQLLKKKLLVKIKNLFKQCATLEFKMNQLQRQESEFTCS